MFEPLNAIAYGL